MVSEACSSYKLFSVSHRHCAITHGKATYFARDVGLVLLAVVL